jgi:hypothetical protein
MSRKKCSLIGLAILLAAGSIPATFAQQTIQSRKLPASLLHKMKPTTAHANEPFLKTAMRKNSGTLAPSTSATAGVDTVVTWSDQFTAPGFDPNGNPQSVWPYTMVGNPPQSGGTTRIEAPMVPVTVQLLAADGTVAYSFGPGLDTVSAALNSPEFVPTSFTSGFGQFNDQQMRAEFWNRIHNSGFDNGWHTNLIPRLRTARRMRIPFLTPSGGNAWYVFVDANNNPVLAAIDEDVFGNLLFPPTFPVTNATPVGAAELAGDITTKDISTFLFNNTVLFFNGNINDCCVIGFHSYDFEPGDKANGNRDRLYVMNYSSWLSPGLFFFGFEDMTPWSHEMAETFNDPFDNNITPWWESVDPFTGSGNCQDDLEVGDVVEVLTALPVYAIPGNGRTYHPQNVALFPWFADQEHSSAHLGAYSFPDETTLMSLSPGNLMPGCVPAP